MDRLVNKSGLQAFFNICSRTAKRWLDDGMPFIKKPANGAKDEWKFDLLEVCQWKYGGLKKNGEEIDPEALPPQDRKAWYEGELKRVQLAKEKKSLIVAAEAERTISTAFQAVAQGLRSIPDHVERRVGASPDVCEIVEEIIDKELLSLHDRLLVLGCEDERRI